MTVRHILVPVDFSDHSNRALDCAKSLAEKYGAALHLLSVVLPANYPEGLRKDAESHLRRLLTHAEQKRLHAESAVAFGDPYREILDYAKRASIDLIVMGTHGRGGMAHVLIGSVAEKVVRTAPCPVMTVR